MAPLPQQPSDAAIGKRPARLDATAPSFPAPSSSHAGAASAATSAATVVGRSGTQFGHPASVVLFVPAPRQARNLILHQKYYGEVTVLPFPPPPTTQACSVIINITTVSLPPQSLDPPLPPSSQTRLPHTLIPLAPLPPPWFNTTTTGPDETRSPRIQASETVNTFTFFRPMECRAHRRVAEVEAYDLMIKGFSSNYKGNPDLERSQTPPPAVVLRTTIYVDVVGTMILPILLAFFTIMMPQRGLVICGKSRARTALLIDDGPLRNRLFVMILSDFTAQIMATSIFPSAQFWRRREMVFCTMPFNTVGAIRGTLDPLLFINNCRKRVNSNTGSKFRVIAFFGLAEQMIDSVRHISAVTFTELLCGQDGFKFGARLLCRVSDRMLRALL
ncbi:hypothetical protein QBC38DRAFT_458630 [Podospora fimiseda]|uniref:Uncharacterized protein n=1 Tax=Podospora fimiseda TaxID=252190 RepID=A0AAN7GQJ7_9PEZI|nr:hypothetical protein QBC38DRAFT_458630 [Podospora fimiseda]